MEWSTSIGIVIVCITSILNSYIVFANDKARNSESNSIRTFFSNILSQYNISTVYFYSYIACSIAYINGYSDCLIIKVSNVGRNNSNVSIRNVCLIYMEQRTCIAAIIIRVINVFNSYIIFTNRKVRNANGNCWVIFSIKCCSIYFSAIDFNNNSTASICNRNRYSYGLIFTISNVGRNNSYTRSYRINMEWCSSISIIIVSIISVFSYNFIFTNSKVRNSESYSIGTFRCNVLGFHFSAIDVDSHFTSSIRNIYSHCNGFIIKISYISWNNCNVILSDISLIYME